MSADSGHEQKNALHRPHPRQVADAQKWRNFGVPQNPRQQVPVERVGDTHDADERDHRSPDQVDQTEDHAQHDESDHRVEGGDPRDGELQPLVLEK